MDAFRSILLPAPEVGRLVDPFRRQGDWAWSHGVPAHLTLAGPFPLGTALPRGALGELAAEIRGTSYELASVGMLGAALCLFPADDAPLLAWRDRVLALIGEPDRVDASWRPHLTVCRLDPATGDTGAISQALERSLPIACVAGGLLVAEMDVAGQARVIPLQPGRAV